MKTKLSVVVPVYNVENYIRECIESIQKQTLEDIEIILVDDGSTDSSGRVCDEYAMRDKRIKVFHTINQGPILARKLGVENAESEYITFVDADDFIAEKSYEYAITDMKQGVDVIAFGIIRYFEERDCKFDLCRYESGIYDKEKIQKYIFPDMIWNSEIDSFGLDPALWNKVVKKQLVWNAYTKMKDLYFHYGEDVAIVYPLMLEAESLSIHQETYYFHRQREVGNFARYINDSKFFDKLYNLYKYLIGIFQECPDFRRQIELFYIHSVMLGRKKYNLPKQMIRHMFPFDKVQKRERIVLYGAGNVGQTYMDQLSQLDYCEVVLWVDKNFEKYSDIVNNPEDIIKTEFDKVVIAIDAKNIRDAVKGFLMGKEIPEQKII